VGSAPAASNPGSASSCYLVTTNAGQLLLECGHGAASKLQLYTHMDRISAILISHMHPDHFFDLVPLKYLIEQFGDRAIPLHLPPAGLEILERLAQSLGEKPSFWSRAYTIETYDPQDELEVSGLRITMCPARHFIPAWSLRLSNVASGMVLGYTSDTAPSDAVVRHLTGANLLLGEATLQRQTTPESDRGHLTGREVGELAARAGVHRLVITHFPHAEAEAILADARETSGMQCDLAIEGLEFRIE
jgi:ribonuclease BN (tRNA processing enzyme)